MGVGGFGKEVIAPNAIATRTIIARRNFGALTSFRVTLRFNSGRIGYNSRGGDSLFKGPLLGGTLYLPRAVNSAANNLILCYTYTVRGGPTYVLFTGRVSSLTTTNTVLTSM